MTTLPRPWWTPEKATRFSFRRASVPTGATTSILVDKSDPSDFVVYVNAFDT